MNQISAKFRRVTTDLLAYPLSRIINLSVKCYSKFFYWFTSGTTSGFFTCMDAGNDFDRLPEGIWHTGPQNCSRKDYMPWFQNTSN